MLSDAADLMNHFGHLLKVNCETLESCWISVQRFVRFERFDPHFKGDFERIQPSTRACPKPRTATLSAEASLLNRQNSCHFSAASDRLEV